MYEKQERKQDGKTCSSYFNVRNLVEFILRSGDLTSRSGTGSRQGSNAQGQPHPPKDPETDGKSPIRQKYPLKKDTVNMKI